MQVRPQTIDALSRTEDVRLRDIFESIPKDCFQIQPLRAWATLLRVLGCFGLLTWLLVELPLTGGVDLLWQIPALTALWVLQGWTLLGLFVLGHDCGHRAFVPQAALNKLVGHLCMSPLSNAFHTWVVTHDCDCGRVGGPRKIMAYAVSTPPTRTH